MDADPEELVIMSPEQYREAYEKAHGHPPPEDDAAADADDLPDCECRTF
ncbi:hypothetical protein [Actinoplanes couchii]|uniref:Uncharacterized protein n=1 Tax=Actinoplanes couchii TaxID=403638 RepID=A0ABQ3XFY8_9ACTN|nr:hypothetical protein [Actinoplanes couchii]MDR6320880.1 hypothetical protein [Actinoplanes couchii]GID57392.1 hypothetical protein Aco03nite_057960 [Actinoplanes couchii]